MRKEKTYWNLKQSLKQELDSYKIDQFHSISSSGRTDSLKIRHGRMIILYRSIQNYSIIEENTLLKERGMLGPYNTSVSPYCYCQSSPLTIIIVPMQSPHCYYGAPQKPTIAIVFPLYCYYYVGQDYIVTPWTPVYRKEFFSFDSSKYCSFMKCKVGCPLKEAYF